MVDWPKKYISWIKDRVLHVSIPFTWELPKVRFLIQQKSIFWDRVLIGGPAIMLMPKYFDDLNYVTIGSKLKGVLQKVNQYATRTTIGCINKCAFCGVSKIEPFFFELDDWPDLPIICDNNILAASINHFDRVINRLVRLGRANFNQGLDARRLTDYHAIRIAEVQEPLIYLALDNVSYINDWACAYDRLRSAGILKRQIRSYALIGFNSGPDEAWRRCNFIESHNIKALPQWYHSLDALKKNIVTAKQLELGWNDYERRRIMQWFYFHKNAVK